MDPTYLLHDDHDESHEGSTVGERVADCVSEWVGSWTFICILSVFLIVWFAVNVYITSTGRDAFDPYPFVLANLLLSFIAAYTAPVIMMAQNRGAQVLFFLASHVTGSWLHVSFFGVGGLTVSVGVVCSQCRFPAPAD